MSHFGVLVITDDGSEDTVTELLAPYDENGTWFRDGSKWDWWVVGGRWTGYLDPTYDPYKDERNYERCRFCEGTGVTTQAVADEYPAYREHVGKPCIQCNAEHDGEPAPFPGKMLRFDLVPHPSDSGTPVRTILERGIDATFAVVTPDGEWHERGSMGWFGMSTDDKEVEAWRQEWHDLLVMHQDKLATIVDCHV